MNPKDIVYKMVVLGRRLTTHFILDIFWGSSFMFHVVLGARAKTPKRVTQPLPVSQTLTSCQMLPVTVTGSAFDRKIVSVLPVPFCQVLVSLWSRARKKETTRKNIWN